MHRRRVKLLLPIAKVLNPQVGGRRGSGSDWLRCGRARCLRQSLTPARQYYRDTLMQLWYEVGSACADAVDAMHPELENKFEVGRRRPRALTHAHTHTLTHTRARSPLAPPPQSGDPSLRVADVKRNNELAASAVGHFTSFLRLFYPTKPGEKPPQDVLGTPPEVDDANMPAVVRAHFTMARMVGRLLLPHPAQRLQMAKQRCDGHARTHACTHTCPHTRARALQPRPLQVDSRLHGQDPAAGRHEAADGAVAVQGDGEAASPQARPHGGGGSQGVTLAHARTHDICIGARTHTRALAHTHVRAGVIPVHAPTPEPRGRPAPTNPAAAQRP